MTPAPPPAAVGVADGLAAAWPGRRPEPVRLGPLLAEGGDAAVYAVDGRPALAAKVYRDPGAEPRRRAKLTAMLAAPPEGALAAPGGEVSLAWPVALLERDAPASATPPGMPAGFLMPRVDLTRAALLEELLSARGRRAAGLPNGVRLRVAVAANLAALVAALHARGHHVVDLKPANVHVYWRTGRVALLDCDGMSIAAPDAVGGAGRFPAHQYTDGYIAPEALQARAEPEDLGEDQDRFALAVVLFRLLNDGFHPFQGVPARRRRLPTTDGGRIAAGLYPYGRGGAGKVSPPSGSPYAYLDSRTRYLFDTAFEPGGLPRPSASVWRRHLRGLLDGGLQRCDADTDHARFRVQACAACASARVRAEGAPTRSLREERPQPGAEWALERRRRYQARRHKPNEGSGCLGVAAVVLAMIWIMAVVSLLYMIVAAVFSL